VERDPEILTRCRHSRTTRGREKDRGNGIQQFIVQPHHTYLFTLKIRMCGVQLFTGLLYATIMLRYISCVKTLHFAKLIS